MGRIRIPVSAMTLLMSLTTNGLVQAQQPDAGPALNPGAGILVLGTLMAAWSMGLVVIAFRDSDEEAARFGLLLLGGFTTAALVVIADEIMKLGL